MPEFNPDKVTIKDLTVEKPEKGSELSFDPERDITGEDWKKINKRRERYIKREKKEKGWQTYIWFILSKWI